MDALSAILGWSLRNRPAVLCGAALLVVAGIRAAMGLSVDAVPDVTNIQVQVLTSAPALSPVEVEHYVTVPVERAMAGIPRVTQMRSISKYSISVVTLVFTEETDIYFARQLVMERLREAQDAVPARYGRAEMGPISSGLGEIFQFVVEGEGYSLMERSTTLAWYIGPQLRMVPGVVEVNFQGGQTREVEVVVDPARLQAAGLSVAEVAGALEKSNAIAGGGYIERDREQIVIGTTGLLQTLDDVRQVVVGVTPQGAPIPVGQIGEVRTGARIRRGAASRDGKGEVVVGVVLMLMGENARTVTAAVKARLAEIAGSLPRGMRVVPFYDRAELVGRTIRTVVINLAEGAALVVLVLLVLLGDVRAGLIVALTIPLSMLFAILLMNALGISGNLMSLGAIDFGLIVDGAVIIVENAVRHLLEARRRRGAPLSPDERRATILGAAVEVRGASLFGEVIIAIVYLPILSLRGIEGKLFRPMAVTVLLALLGAFVMSLTVVPALASYLLVPRERERETWLMRRAHALYLPLQHRALGHRRATLGVGLVLLVLGAGLFTRLGAEFIPQLDEGYLLVESRRLPGIALSETLATDARLQRAILEVPEVLHITGRTGSPEVANDYMGIEETDHYVEIRPRHEWRPGLTRARLGEELSAAMERAVPDVAGSISQPIQMRTNELLAGVHSDVAAQIYGPDLEVLQEIGDRVAAVLQHIPGAVEVRAARGAGLSYLRIRPDRARLARYGLTVEDVNTLTETLAVGSTAGAVLEGDRRYRLAVKMAGIGGDLDTIRALPLKSPGGQMVPLGEVAEVGIEKGPALVAREKHSRRLGVEFNVRGRDLVSVVEEGRAAVGRKVRLPAGYRVEWEGEFQNFLDARGRLALVVPLALGLILFMLWLAFRALVPAVLIFLNIPFAVVGGVVALWLRGIPFSISAGVGFIALFGVAVLNGLVLLSFCRQLEAEGMGPGEAIRRAASLRLRPVLMTALVAALGFLPMALSQATGSEVQRPLATVVIGGLGTATLLTLLLFPAVYLLLRPESGHRRSN